MSFADLGAGPGTSVFALAERFPHARFRLYERDPQFVALGRQLLEGARPALYEFVTADLASEFVIDAADVVLLSYSLGELAEPAAAAAIDRAWAAARQAIVVIEPGSRRGYQTVLQARDRLSRAGGTVAAPCPSDSPCPLAGDDWCHFAARVSRSRLHRRVKGADLAYEDEKFAYVVVSKRAARPAAARIIRRPHARPRAVEIACCTSRGIERATIGRGDRERYRAARAARWGDAWVLGLTRAREDEAVRDGEVHDADHRDRGEVPGQGWTSPGTEPDGQ